MHLSSLAATSLQCFVRIQFRGTVLLLDLLLPLEKSRESLHIRIHTYTIQY